MDWGALIGPAVVAAVVSGAVAIVGYRINARTARTIHSERLAFEKRLTELKFGNDKELAEKKFEFDRQLASRKFEFDKELAERKFALDKEQLVHKRRVELAEVVVAEFSQVADAIRSARSTGMGFISAVERPRRKEETDEQARQIDMYYMPMALLRRETTLISELMSKRHRSQAVFGAEIGQAFEEISCAINRIRVSSDSLVHSVLEPNGIRQRNEKNIEQYLGDIWDGYSDTDRIQPRVSRAIEIVESVCRPILEGDGV